MEYIENWLQAGVTLEMNGADVMGLGPEAKRLAFGEKMDMSVKHWMMSNSVHIGYVGDDFKVYHLGEEIFSAEVFAKHRHYNDALQAALNTNDLTHGALQALRLNLDVVKYNELEVMIRKI